MVIIAEQGSLLCGFAIWLMWGIITVQMLNLGFPFSKTELFTLMSIAGPDGVLVHDVLNPNGPSALMCAWMGPFIGAFSQHGQMIN